MAPLKKQLQPTTITSNAMAGQDNVLDEVENNHRSSLKTSKVVSQLTLMSQMSFGHLTVTIKANIYAISVEYDNSMFHVRRFFPILGVNANMLQHTGCRKAAALSFFFHPFNMSSKHGPRFLARCSLAKCQLIFGIACKLGAWIEV